MGLRVQLFGAPQLVRDGRVVTFDTRKAVALLAYLAVQGGRHRRESLAALLWPGAESAKGRATLRRTLSVASAVGPALRVEGAEVWLDEDLVDCDVTRFRVLAAGDDPAGWASAAQLASAPFLDGFTLRDSPTFDDWLQAASDALADSLSRILGRLAVSLADGGDLAAAAGHAQRRVALDPLSEPAVVDAMRILAWSGDQSAALQQYRALVRRLDRELGIDPLPATRELAAAIRSQRLDPPAAPASSAPGSPAAGSRTADLPAARIPHPVGFVDREAERAVLEEALRSAGSGAAVVVGITGDPGVGRTALLDQVRHVSGGTLPSGSTVLSVTGRAAEQKIGYAAAADLFAPLIGEPAALGRIPGPAAAALVPLGAPGPLAAPFEGSTRLLFDAVRQLVAAAAAQGPVVIAIDDVQHLDESSQDLLSYLVRRLPDRTLAVLTWPSYSPGAGLVAAAREAGGSRVVRVRPLSESAVGQLVAELGGEGRFEAADVARRTGGLPQLVVELVAADLDDRSAQVQQVLDARLAEAGSVTRQVLAASAVLGVPADPDVLRATCGRDEAEVVDAVEEALRLGLLVEQQPGSVDLPHALARRTVLGQLSTLRLRLLHRRAAEHLARRSGGAAAAVAEHFSAAGDDQEAAQWHRSAADAAWDVGANAECLHHLTQVLAHEPAALGVQARIGDVLVRLGRYDQAVLAYERAGAEEPESSVAGAELEHRIAGLHARRGDPVQALSHLESARAALPDGADPALRARLSSEAALMSMRCGDPASARSLGEAALALGRSCGDVVAQARAQTVLGLVLAAEGDADGARTQLEQAVAAARAGRDDAVLLAALNSLARCLLAADRPEEAAAHASQALALAQRRGDSHLVGVLHSAVADTLHELGRDDEAQQHLSAAAAALSDVAGQQDRPGIWLLDQW